MDIRLLYSKHAFLRSELDLEASAEYRTKSSSLARNSTQVHLRYSLSDFSWDVDLCDIEFRLHCLETITEIFHLTPSDLRKYQGNMVLPW